MARVGVILSGSGVYDGSELHETVLTLLALDRNGAEAVCMAPNIDQLHVVNHLTGEVATGESRNVLDESARVARGKIVDIKSVSADDLDALIIPGGFGAAKNLCSFAVDGADCSVDSGVASLLQKMHAAGKPIAAICIAPAILAKVLGSESPSITIGNDEGTAAALESMGSNHINCPVTECIIDEERKLITSPAYMLAQRISEAATGIEKTVDALLKMS